MILLVSVSVSVSRSLVFTTVSLRKTEENLEREKYLLVFFNCELDLLLLLLL